MRELGYVEGRDFVVEWRFADGQYDRFPDFARELIGLNVDVFVLAASAAIPAVQQATSTIPIVMGYSTDPVGNGFVASLSRPGGNITGLASSSDDTAPKQIELLKAVVPDLSRVAVLVHPKSPNFPVLKRAQAAAAAADVAIVSLQASNLSGVEGAFAEAVRERVHAVVLVPDSVFNDQRRHIAELAVAKRLPLICANREYVEAGALMSYGENIRDFIRRTAGFVDKMIKGAKPSDLPVEQPTRFFLVINLPTAKTLGLTVPSNLLALADEVIE
jgi:putative ABC transport system substrate-binding protein